MAAFHAFDLSGEIESARLDATALGLTPLELKHEGIWEPDEHYWGEKDEPIEEWTKPIIAKGPRPEFVSFRQARVNSHRQT